MSMSNASTAASSDSAPQRRAGMWMRRAVRRRCHRPRSPRLPAAQHVRVRAGSWHGLRTPAPTGPLRAAARPPTEQPGPVGEAPVPARRAPADCPPTSRRPGHDRPTRGQARGRREWRPRCRPAPRRVGAPASRPSRTRWASQGEWRRARRSARPRSGGPRTRGPPNWRGRAIARRRRPPRSGARRLGREQLEAGQGDQEQLRRHRFRQPERTPQRITLLRR